MVEKLDLPFPLLSDPRGDVIKSLGLWNEKESVSEPAIVALDGSGRVQYSYSGGTDFSDRPTNEVLFSLLESVEKEAGRPRSTNEIVRVSVSEAEEETVRPDRAPMELEFLKAYYTGSHFSAIAMQKKLEGEARGAADGYRELVDEYMEAINTTVKARS